MNTNSKADYSVRLMPSGQRVEVMGPHGKRVLRRAVYPRAEELASSMALNRPVKLGALLAEPELFENEHWVATLEGGYIIECAMCAQLGNLNGS